MLVGIFPSFDVFHLGSCKAVLRCCVENKVLSPWMSQSNIQVKPSSNTRVKNLNVRSVTCLVIYCGLQEYACSTTHILITSHTPFNNKKQIPTTSKHTNQRTQPNNGNKKQTKNVKMSMNIFFKIRWFPDNASASSGDGRCFLR